MEILKKAFGNNDEQIECASWVEGPLMVLAGPGVGKTRVLTHRIGYLLRLYPNDVFRVLALTFTNKAAEEMGRRLRKIPGYVRARVWAGTFHGFCTYLLRQYSCYVGIVRSFTTIDDNDQLEIIRDVQVATGLPKADPRNIRSHISRAKSRLKTPEEYRSMLESEGGSPVPAHYYAEYERRMRAFNLLDYDDLIWWAIRLLRDIPAVRRIVHDTYRFVLVDECQDTTLAQHELIGFLVPGEKPNLFAVADENQSIFEWNNARVQNLADMITRYDMEVKNLNRSYRCPPEVLRLANKIILKADNRVIDRRGKLVSEKGARPGCVSIQACESDDEEARRVLEIIQTGLEEGRHPGDFAIIGRTRFTFREIEVALTDAEIPYVIVGDSGFLREPEIAAYMAALRVLLNPDDAESLRQLAVQLHPDDGAVVSAAIQWCTDNRRSLREAIGYLDRIGVPLDGARRVQHLYNRLQRRDAAQLDALTALKFVEEVLGLHRSAYADSWDGDDQMESLGLLWEMARQFYREAEDRILPAFVARLSLERRGDVLREVEQDPDHVKLLTVHAAKGTEYPVVIIVGLEEGLFPHHRSEEEGLIDEERRNFYVAMTRTEERLVLSFAKCRKDSHGRPWPKQPSRFLQEIADDAMES